MKVKSKPAIDVNRYLMLMREFPPIPVTSDAQLSTATKVLHALLDKWNELSVEEEAYVHVLGNLIDEYEEVAHSIEPATDSEMIEHLIDAREITQAKLAHDTGISESTVSAVLNGSRALTREQVAIVSAYFGVEPGVFAFRPRVRDDLTVVRKSRLVSKKRVQHGAKNKQRRVFHVATNDDGSWTIKPRIKEERSLLNLILEDAENEGFVVVRKKSPINSTHKKHEDSSMSNSEPVVKKSKR